MARRGGTDIGSAPAKGAGIAVVGLDEGIDPVPHLAGGSEAGVLQGLAAEDAEPDFVGSKRGAVPALRPARFPASPSEPGMRATTHPALHDHRTNHLSDNANAVTEPHGFAISHSGGMREPR